MGSLRASESVGENDDHIVKLEARFRRPLLAYFTRRTADRAEAEDLTQEVFLRIVGNRNLTFDKVEALIFTIARNLLRDKGRRGAVRGEQVQLPDENSPRIESFVEVLDPSRVLLGKDELDRAMAALMRLPERTRDIFILKRIEGMKNKEIANAMGISASAVEKHFVKALAHMAKTLPIR